MHLPHYSTNRVLDQNHITLLILTSCRVHYRIGLGSARGSSPFDLARQCGFAF
jgi:hypothetical protein